MTAIGTRYDRLTVVAPAPPGKRNTSRWLVRCDCGKELVVAQSDLRSAHTRSCGCFRKEVTAQRTMTHGRSETAEFGIWCHMIGRCYNETDHKYPNYGGRGIRVCERWRGSFENFLADMGERPSPKHTIDRKDNDGPYEPSNCRWATAIEQGQNKRNNVWVILHGERMVTAEAARRLGISPSSITQMVKIRSCSPQEAVDCLAAKYSLRSLAQQVLLRSAAPAGTA